MYNQFMPIRTKLLIIFLSLSLLPLLLVSVLTFKNYKHSLREARLSQLNDIATLKSRQIEAYFSYLMSHIKVAQNFYNVKVNLPVLIRFSRLTTSPEFLAAKKVLDGQLPKFQEIAGIMNILLLDSRGEVRYASDQESVRWRPTTFFAEQLKVAFLEGKKGIYFTEVFRNKENSRVEMMVSAPAVDLNGAPVGVIVFEVDMTSVYTLIHDNTGLGETGETLIAKKKGNEVLFLSMLKYDKQPVLEKHLTMGDEVGLPAQKAVQGQSGSGESIDYRGRATIAAWRYIPSMDWGMVVKIDSAEAFADVIALKNMTVFILSIVAILGLVMAFLLARSIAEPIRRLSQGVRLIGSGRLDHRVSIPLNNEIGELSEAFDSMSADLQQVMASRDELNHEIIERKQAEDALRSSEMRLRRMYEAGIVGVIYWNVNGGIVDANDKFLEMTGYTREDLVAGKIDWANMTPLEYKHLDEASLQELKTFGINKVPFEKEYIRKDGSRIPILIAGAMLDEARLNGVAFVLDISQRKKSEVELSNQRAELQTILDAAPALIFYKDKENRFLRVNAAFAELMGMSKEELEGRSLFDIYPPEQAESFWRDDNEVIFSGQPKFDIVEPVQAVDHLRWFQTDKIPYRDAQGVIIGIIGFAIDITERKRMDDKLHKLNRTLRALSDSNKAILRAENESAFLHEACGIILDDCGHLMVWVGFAEDDEAKTVRPVAQAGFEEGYLESINISWADTEHGRGPTGVAIRTGKPCLCRNMLTDPDFEPWRSEALKRGYAASAVFPLISNNKAFGAVSIYSKFEDPFSQEEIDLLEELVDNMAYGVMALRIRADHAKAETALHERETQMRLFVEHAPAAIAMFDTCMRYIAASQRWLEDFGVSGHDLRGHSHYEIFPGIPEKWKEVHRRCLAGAIEFAEEDSFVRGDGSTQWLRWEVRPWNTVTGMVGGIIIFSEDITERKCAQDILRRDKETFEKLVQERTKQLVDVQIALDRAKRLSDIGTLASTVAHELRNPLAAISMAAENIRRKAPDPNIEKHLASIALKVADGEQIINNLLFYSRLKPPNYQTINILPIIEECVEVIARNTYKKVHFTISMDNAMIRADALQMREVFSNIFHNACDAIGHNGGKVFVTGHHEHDFLKVVVKDTGHGMSPEDLKKVFDPFFTTKAKGTGLGLAVCQQVVVFHGGTISFESELGKGTSVIIRLPKQDSPTS